MNSKHLFLIGFAISIGMITYSDIVKCHDLPWPPRFIGAAIAFSILDIFSVINEELAGVIAIGIVIAIVVQTVTPKNKGAANFKFISNCDHTKDATVQPASFQTLDTAPPGTIVA